MIRSDSTSLDDYEHIVNSSSASRGEANSDAEFNTDDELQVTVVKDKTLSELISGLEEKLLSAITRNHEETTKKIDLLEARMEERLKEMETKMTSIDERRIDEMNKLMILKQESKEKETALISEMKAQLGEIKEGVKKADKPSSRKCACLAARKGAMECLGKIKSRCMKPFTKEQTTSQGVVAADTVVALDADGSNQIHSLVLTNRKACRVAFRAEGANESRRWFVSGITEPPPCSLRVGDEIVTIGGVAVAGVSLERIKEMVGAIEESGNVEVRRPETVEALD